MRYTQHKNPTSFGTVPEQRVPRSRFSTVRNTNSIRMLHRRKQDVQHQMSIYREMQRKKKAFVSLRLQKHVSNCGPSSICHCTTSFEEQPSVVFEIETEYSNMNFLKIKTSISVKVRIRAEWTFPYTFLNMLSTSVVGFQKFRESPHNAQSPFDTRKRNTPVFLPANPTRSLEDAPCGNKIHEHHHTQHY